MFPSAFTGRIEALGTSPLMLAVLIGPSHLNLLGIPSFFTSFLTERGGSAPEPREGDSF